MFRALRADKLIYQALETTLRYFLMECWDRIPVLRMIRLSEAEIRERAARFLERLDGLKAELATGLSVIGGGATPEQSLPTCLVALRPANVMDAERRLRAGEPPVIARIEDDRLLIDLRTVSPEEENELAAALQGLSATGF
jgi:L-seryl-tRNA(Ser) seleniumtransferase